MEIESLGATLEARTSRDWAHFYTVVSRRYLDKALDVVADVVSHPKFRQEDIEHERLVILDEIARKESDPFSVLSDKLFQTAYTAHPYRLPVEGTRKTVMDMNREKITEYYSRLYVPGNMTLVIVGDVTHADAVAAARKAFADLAKKPLVVPATPNEPERTHKATLKENRNTKQCYVGVAFVGPSVKDRPDVFAMDILLAHLGIGYQSWLSTELKDTQKLASQVTGDYLTQRDSALVILAAATDPSKSKDVEKAILAKIESVQTGGITPAELQRAKRWILGTYAFDTETFSGRATNIGFYNTIGSGEVAASYSKSIADVTLQDISNAAKKYLDPTMAVVVEVGP
jgi:predicted Zn-dependent peptidase